MVAPAYSNLDAELLAASDLKTAVTGLLVGCVMKLGKALLPITRFTTLAELQAEEADYTGYASEAVVWSANSIDDAGRAELIGTAGEFRPTAATVGNQIYYAWVENGNGDLVLAWEIENGPVQMAAVTDSYLATARLRPGLAGDASEVT